MTKIDAAGGMDWISSIILLNGYGITSIKKIDAGGGLGAVSPIPSLNGIILVYNILGIGAAGGIMKQLKYQKIYLWMKNIYLWLYI